MRFWPILILGMAWPAVAFQYPLVPQYRKQDLRIYQAPVASPTPTRTVTATPTGPTPTASRTVTATRTWTPIATPTITATITRTVTPIATRTPGGKVNLEFYGVRHGGIDFRAPQ